MESIRTVPLNQSDGPLIDAYEPILLMSILVYPQLALCYELLIPNRFEPVNNGTPPSGRLFAKLPFCTAVPTNRFFKFQVRQENGEGGIPILPIYCLFLLSASAVMALSAMLVLNRRGFGHVNQRTSDARAADPLPVRGPVQAAAIQQSKAARSAVLAAAARLRRMPQAHLWSATHRLDIRSHSFSTSWRAGECLIGRRLRT